MSKAIRDVYGEALAKYGKENPNVVVLDADVSSSTKSAYFAQACPERFINVGIAESNMTAMAAGLASVGKIPFVNTFAVFLTSLGLTAARAFGSYSEIPVKMAGAYGGMSDSYDGPSHHALEDLAIMRALPNFQIFVPCDAVQTDWLVKYAIETPKPIYLRLSRDALPDIYVEGKEFACGKGNVITEGTDVTVIACGLMVNHAQKAAVLLREEGIAVRVVDMFCIKPLDRELIVRCAKETGAIVTAEEHNVIGGLGSAVAEVLAQENCMVPVVFTGVQDRHGECGPYERLQEKYGFDTAAIIENIRCALKRK